MKVLLTGANGFVGSHVLDRLLEERIPARVLLRRRADTSFIHPHLSRVEVCHGGFEDPAGLEVALAGVTHVVHCAGATKALTREGLFHMNQRGTRNLVEAINTAGSRMQRLVHLSSLAAGGAGTRAAPAREMDEARPLSAYGESKLAGEQEVLRGCRCEFTILRPGGVYGPRDREFLRIFRAAAAGITPLFGGGRQELRLVFAPDLAEVIVRAIRVDGAVGAVVNVAADEVVTTAELVRSIAAAIPRRAMPLPLPMPLLNLVCSTAGFCSILTRKPTLLAWGKYRELAAPGWVADTERLHAIFGEACRTGLKEGLLVTRDWFREHGWLR